MLPDATRFYINGEWVAPISTDRRQIINPSTEEPIGEVALGNAADVDRAVVLERSSDGWVAATTFPMPLGVKVFIDPVEWPKVKWPCWLNIRLKSSSCERFSYSFKLSW